jgi:hypothetical protein
MPKFGQAWTPAAGRCSAPECGNLLVITVPDACDVRRRTGKDLLAVTEQPALILIQAGRSRRRVWGSGRAGMVAVLKAPAVPYFPGAFGLYAGSGSGAVIGREGVLPARAWIRRDGQHA